ncbi:unnamed protein product [Clonostachys rhizophaga]|uniref:Aminoglycoside phosphotransferase domain-containing protein n=1 Tax=Clonostachys rhizophaga TaxID=160324 RepID=A0A9N9W1M3_9HYPO|nr:unnamed protein product [Clonostachys rhizophaga]
MARPQYLPDSRTKWTTGSDSYPIWPSDPEISIISEIAASVLGLPTDSLSVRFLDDGAYHKVYDISQTNISPTSVAYLFRVAVAVDPVHKMESEMATLEFLRQKTTIPVPKPIAWNSSAANPLGYEWALLEKVPGVDLHDVWLNLPWEKKVNIVESIAGYLAQIWSLDLRFPKIGSLYRATFVDQEHITNTPPSATPANISSISMSRADSAFKEGFKMGPVVDGAFFSDRRRYLESDRGPYTSCSDWLRARIEIEKEYIRTGKLLIEEQQTMEKLEDADDLANEIGIGLDKDDDFDTILDTCDGYMRALPLVFPPPKTSKLSEARFVLRHCDLRGANIIVHPETFNITGIIDWESTRTVPEWYGLNYPLLIQDMDPFTSRPSKSAVAALKEEGTMPEDRLDILRFQWSLWEKQDLREVFDRKLEQLGFSKDWRPNSPEDDLKSRFIKGVRDLADFWPRSANILEKIESKTQLAPKVTNIPLQVTRDGASGWVTCS